MIRFEWMMAGRYLRSRRQEGFISVIAIFSFLGIALGVGTLIIVMAVMNGFRQELLGRILGLNGHLILRERSGSIEPDPILKEALERATKVQAVIPVVEGQALIVAGNRASGGLVRGIAPRDFVEHRSLYQNIIQGRVEDFGGEGIAIGYRMAAQFGVNVGDRITLITPQGKTTLFGTVPRMRSYVVAALFDAGMYEYDSSLIFMPLETAQTFFQLQDRVSGIEIFLDQAEEIGQARQSIEPLLDPQRHRLLDWRQTRSTFFTALQVERNVMFLILTLIILVAAFNIISSLIMLVKDKSKDIAILRTMGATQGMIMRIFILTGGLIGVIGTATGVALGVAFCENIEVIRQGLQGLLGVELFSAEIYYLTTLPAEMEWMEVLQVTVMALSLSFLATLYPSWRASRLDPVEVLRYE